MKKHKYSKTLKEIKDSLRHDTKSCLSIEYIDKQLLSLSEELSGSMADISNEIFPLPIGQVFNGADFYLYSDGACRGNPGAGAWGTLVQDSSGKLIYEDAGVLNPTTNNQMELEGAIKALEFVVSNSNSRLTELNVHLFSDSKYVVEGLKSWAYGWKKRGWKKADKRPPENLEYWKRIDELRDKFTKINYHWVKGHSGHPQNEHCDLLANNVLNKNGH